MYPESIPDSTFWFPFFIIIAPPRLHLRPTLMYHYVPRAPSNHGYLIAMRCCFSKHIQKPHARTENVQNAIGGYKEINLRGMKLLKPGGFLVTSSCTNLVQPDVFYQTIEMAAKDAKRNLRQVVFQSQSADHPIIKGLENTNYLKFLIVQVL
jgi:hypothetical protein